jgi:peroxiredoxin
MLAARALLALVFGVAALAKMLAGSESQVVTFREFGAGERLSRLGGMLLPPAELAVAVAVMIVPTARWAAAGAAVLLVAFLAGISNALLQGRRPDCGCFGALRPAPIGAWTLGRNAVLVAVAALVAVAGPGPAVDGWLGSRDAASLVALSIIILAVGFWLQHSLRRAAAREGAFPTAGTAMPSAGDPAPEFVLSDASGSMITLGSLLEQGRPLMLVFASPGCGSCSQVFAEMRRWQTTFAGRIRIAVIAVGEPEPTRQALEGYQIGDLLTGTAGDVQQAYGVRGTPAAVVVAPDRTIVASAATGQDRIEDLIRLTLRRFDPMHDPWNQTIHVA